MPKRPDIHDAYLEAEYEQDIAFLEKFAAQQALEHAAMVEAGDSVTEQAMALPEGRSNDCPSQETAPQTIDLATLWPKDAE